MNNGKVKAFTLFEITIAMLVTALLVGLTYVSYTIITQSHRAFASKNESLAILFNVDHLLKRDFDQAEVIFKIDKGIKIIKQEQIIYYEFSPELIVRKAAGIDSFRVTNQNLITLFENTPLTDINDKDELNRIDELSLLILYQKEKIPYTYHKTYSALNLIQRNTHAVN